MRYLCHSCGAGEKRDLGKLVTRATRVELLCQARFTKSKHPWGPADVEGNGIAYIVSHFLLPTERNSMSKRSILSAQDDLEGFFYQFHHYLN